MLKITSQEEAVRLLRQQDSEFFSIVFFRRTDRRDRSQEAGDLRLFRSCRRRVTKHLRGGRAAYSFKEKRLLSLYVMADPDEVRSSAYRCVPYEGIFALKMGGTVVVTAEGLARLCDRSTASSDQAWLQRSVAAFGHVESLLERSGSPLRLERPAALKA